MTTTTTPFLLSLSMKLKVLQSSLELLLREESLAEDNVLSKKGFLIHSYTIRTNVNTTLLEKLKSELENIVAREQELVHFYQEVEKELRQIEINYYVYQKKKLEIRDIFQEKMNNALNLSRLVLIKINELLSFLQDKKRINITHAGSDAKKILNSVEKMTSQILIFTKLVQQITEIAQEFEKELYYPNPRIYGRVMSKEELQKMKKERLLSSSQDPTPVFDCPQNVFNKLKNMSKDERRDFFRTIGVRSIEALVIFQTSLKPLIGPIPQTNGLREYKFPKGIAIEILDVAA